MGSSPKHNIVVFGESGSGKSSIVNMIVGDDVAKVSNGLVGCTFKHKRYKASIGATRLHIYDTAGLNEGEQGRVPHWEAVRELYTLIRTLDSVSLLVYCMRGRIKENTRANWILFHDVLCAKEVPTIVVETGVEHVEDLNNRSEMAKRALEPYEIVPTCIACIVSFRGPKNEYEHQYNSSQARLQQLIVDSYKREPWSTTRDNWIDHIYETTYSTKLCFFSDVQVEFTQGVGNVVDEFIKKTGMKEDESDQLKTTLLNAEKRLRNKLMIRVAPSPKNNIIIFGETGSGKSSMVNMIIGNDVAEVSDGHTGCTSKHEPYETSIDQTDFNIYDTVGLNEGEKGSVPHWKAVHDLYTLIRSLDNVSLLIYCMRGHINKNTRANWILFHKILCATKVPAIAVETAVESVEDLDRERMVKTELEKYAIFPSGIACIAAFRGPQKKYDISSQSRLRQLIVGSYRREPWGMTTDNWIGQIYSKPKWFFSDAKTGKVIDEYIEEAGMNREESDKLKSALLDAEKKFRARK